MADQREQPLDVFRRAVEEITGEVPAISPSTPIPEAGIDSLDLIEVGMIMEDTYDIEISEAVFDGVETVGDVLRAVQLLILQSTD